MSPERATSASAPARGWLASALVGSAVYFLVGLWNGRRHIFLADTDEGYTLIKVLLTRRGRELYSEIWNDQPPGYTWLLDLWMRFFGEAVENARLLTSAFVAVFAFGCFELSRRRVPGPAGYAGGLVCVLALLLQNGMFRYGAAAMISLPAVLCMGLAWQVSSLAHARSAWIVTGTLIALSLSIKPIGLPALPGICVGVFLRTTSSTRSLRLATESVAWVLGSAVILSAVLFLPVFLRDGGEAVYQAVTPSSPFVWPGVYQLGRFVREDSWLIAGVGLGLFALLPRHRADAVSLTLWLGFGALAIAHHSPVWTHHRYLLLIPAVPLTGLGVAVCLETALAPQGSVRRRLSRAALFTCAALSLLLFPAGRLEEITTLLQTRPEQAHPLLRRVRAFAPGGTRMVASNPMFAYRLGAEVPPFLAITSRKRFDQVGLSAEALVQASLAFDPDLVELDKRWPEEARTAIENALQRTHLVVYEAADTVALVRMSLIPPNRLKRLLSSQRVVLRRPKEPK